MVMKKNKVKRKRTINTRQKKAITNLLLNGGKEGKALKDAGYRTAYARNPAKFKKTQAGQTFLKAVDKERDAALKEAKKKRKEANYRDCVYGVDTMTKLGRLERGDSTENTKLELDFSGWKR